MGQASFDLLLLVPRDVIREYLKVSHTEPRYTAAVGPVLNRVARDACTTLDEHSLFELRHTTGVSVRCELSPGQDAKTRVKLRAEWSPLSFDSHRYRQAIVDVSMRLYGLEFGYRKALSAAGLYRR